MRLAVMVFPAPDYLNPADVAERRERRATDLSSTCFGCLHRYLYDAAYTCMAEVPEFPHKSKETCQWYKRR